ncbi:MAG: glycosyltransferase family 4 protein, partial [Dehalococcoidia bacterium]|nr:glycosyltransferase family 4 protein [Dehalococcoidia bacterium]
IVIALTEDMGGAMRKICDRDIIVVPNGIDLEQFENLSRKRARSELQIEEQEKVILFVGKLLPVKGVQYLIQAMDIIRRREADARLLLVGDGDQRDCLRSLVKQLNLGKHVTFVGWVSNEKVPKYMAASDVFVLPSLSEGFALVILEAMASGLPIVATRVGGLPDIVKERRNGFLVEPRSPMEIAEKILLLSADGELRRRFSRNNKRKVKAYSWPAVVTRIEEIYLSCLSAKA